jgi:hypothetical protein
MITEASIRSPISLLFFFLFLNEIMRELFSFSFCTFFIQVTREVWFCLLFFQSVQHLDSYHNYCHNLWVINNQSSRFIIGSILVFHQSPHDISLSSTKICGKRLILIFWLKVWFYLWLSFCNAFILSLFLGQFWTNQEMKRTHFGVYIIWYNSLTLEC